MKKSGTIYDASKLSQLDPGQVVKDIHDFYGNAARTLDVRSVVSSYYSHFRAEYNSDSNPVKVSYYHGLTAHITDFTSLMASSLAGKFITLRSAPDNVKRVVWFNVDGANTVPSVSGAETYIEVPVDGTDVSLVTAAAIKLTINGLYRDLFFVQTNGSKVSIKSSGFGLVDDSEENTSGLVFLQTAGTQEVVRELDIPYVGLDPYYEGEILKGYSFDIYSGKFIRNLKVDVAIDSIKVADADGDQLAINPDGSINVNVVSTAQVLKSYFSEIAGVATGITEQVCSYTPIEDVYLQKIEFSGTNIATFELYVDGVLTDRKLTYFSGNLEGVFNFDQGLNVATGQEIEVRVYHNRPDSGAFSARMQILESGT